MKKLTTFDDVLALWEKPKALSDDLGVPYVNAQAMKARGSIGVGHWPKLLELLQARGYRLTTDDLAKMWKIASEKRRARDRVAA
jgi:hypothetical protein